MKLNSSVKNIKKIKTKIITMVSVFILSNVFVHILFYILPKLLKGKLGNISIYKMFFHLLEIRYFKVFLYVEILIILLCIYLYIISEKKYSSDTMYVTDKIKIPVSRGQGQFGSARFATKKEIEEYFNIIDFKIDSHEEYFKEIYKANKEENSKLTTLDLSVVKEDLSLKELIKDKESLRDLDLDEIKKYLGNREDLKEILKSKLTLYDIKRIDFNLVRNFDTYYKKLTSEEFNEVLIALNGADKKIENLVYETMVKVRYDTIEQLNEIRYAIKDDIDEVVKFASNKFNAGQMKQLRLAYKDKNNGKIKNGKNIDKYLLNPNLKEELMKEIREALIENRNVVGYVDEDIPVDLIKKIKGIETKKKEVEQIKEVMPLFKKAGLVLGKQNLSNGKERIYTVDEAHSLIIGETGSGKTRSMVLQTITTLALASENMIITDIKGELNEYTEPFLKSLGYEVICINFRQPLKSHKINFLQPIIDAINNDDIGSAIDFTWDIVGGLVGENNKGEPIWTNGEAAVIAGAIMSVVYDNRHKPYLQNFANVYHFISTMNESHTIVIDEQGNTKTIVPIDEYVKELEDTHPAKGLFSITKVAPSRTKGSFFTSALTTLRLFTAQNLADMTSESNFRLEDVGTRKMAVFIILPEDTKTYNTIASIYMGFQYQALSKVSDKMGGRLKRKCSYILDEFGNFPAIPNFLQIITIARSKGIRINIFLQNITQLEKSYEKDGANTILNNCKVWVYISSNDAETLKLLSERLSTYTVASYSVSNNTEMHKTSNSSYSIQLSSRNLLNVNELSQFSNNYFLVFSKINPAIMKSYDFSEWSYRKLLNLGTREKDIKVRYLRGNNKKERILTNQEYWNLADEILEKVKERSL